ncbi:Ig-like domain-containing protein [Thalassotalea euphylliae]|uniref:Ig-like domain-containing protein n=1 Tax=Thalassotalea euphylliae TaxID=1655234 RepID=UPI003637D44E
MTNSSLRQLFLVSTIFSLAACGGGGGGGSSSSSSTAANVAPVAADDSVQGFVNSDVVISVLANDRDQNNDTLSISSVSSPGSGQATISGNDIVYRANEGFIGSDTFSYTVSDGKGGSDTATVSVSIENKPPTAVNDTVSTTQSQSAELDILENDSSLAGHDLTIVSVTAPSNGQVSLSGNVATYVPNNGFVGQDSFGYVVRDTLGDESTATVTVSVDNQLPVGEADSVATEQNVAVVITPLDNDLDAVGDTLSVAGTTLASHGQIELSGNEITYTPDDGYVGVDEFSYTLVDNYGASSEATVSIDVSNALPVVEDDTAIALTNRSETIDVLANDSDVVGDAISIESVSQPSNGTVTIEDNKLVYQSNPAFEGTDLFGYTVVDSYGASASGFVNVEVNNGIMLTGIIEDVQQSGVDVLVTAGSYNITVQTDSDGKYEAQISIEEPNAIVTAAADHPTASYTINAYFGDVSTLDSLANEALVVENQDITYLTNAEFALVNFLAGGAVTNAATLLEHQLHIDSVYLFDFALAARMLVESSDVSLPSGFSSINALMASPFVLRENLSQWRADYPNAYYQQADALFNNTYSSSTVDFDAGDTVQFQNYAVASSMYTVESMVLESNGSGYLVKTREQLPMTWVKNDTSFTLSFSEGTYIRPATGYYCADGSSSTSRQNFNTDELEYRFMYRLGTKDVYVRKGTGSYEDSNCFDNTVHFNTFDAVDVMTTDTITLTDGSYYLATIKEYSQTDIDNGADQYYTASGLVEFSANGTFTEQVSEIYAQESGNWVNSDGNLVLSYASGLEVTYRQIDQIGESPIWTMSVEDTNTGELIGDGSTFAVLQDTPVFAQREGLFAFFDQPLIDNRIDPKFAIDFQSGTTGVQTSFDGDTWNDSISGVFSWSFSDNQYDLQYYRNPNTGEYLQFCDVSDADCEQWRFREFELIGMIDGYFLVRVYQEWNLPGQPIKAGYVGLFEYLPTR